MYIMYYVYTFDIVLEILEKFGCSAAYALHTVTAGSSELSLPEVCDAHMRIQCLVAAEPFSQTSI